MLWSGRGRLERGGWRVARGGALIRLLFCVNPCSWRQLAFGRNIIRFARLPNFGNLGKLARLHTADHPGREVHQTLLEMAWTDNTIGVWEYKSAYARSSLLPFLSFKNPFINPELEDVHSPFGGFLKQKILFSSKYLNVQLYFCWTLSRGKSDAAQSHHRFCAGRKHSNAPHFLSAVNKPCLTFNKVVRLDF